MIAATGRMVTGRRGSRKNREQGRQGSNLRQLVLETRTLPTELHPCPRVEEKSLPRRSCARQRIGDIGGDDLLPAFVGSPAKANRDLTNPSAPRNRRDAAPLLEGILESMVDRRRSREAAGARSVVTERQEPRPRESQRDRSQGWARERRRRGQRAGGREKHERPPRPRDVARDGEGAESQSKHRTQRGMP